MGVAETSPFPELLFMHADSSLMVKLYYHGVELQQANNYTLEGNILKFSINHENFVGSFEGELIQDTIKGNLLIDSKAFPCNFISIQPEGPETVSEFAGFYQIDDTHIIKCEPYPLDFTLTPILITDFKTGKKRVAFPKGNNQYLSGNRQLAPYPTDLNISLIKDDNDIPSVRLDDGGIAKIGQRLKDLNKTIEFTAENRGITLHASLHLPDTEGPHPLVVIVHGAGNQSRENHTLADFASLLPYYGMATLVYDKRGTGQSEGVLQQADFATLAQDVKLLIEATENFEQIDIDKTGLLGVDQAGLLMPSIAKENKRIQFIAGISTPITNMQEQELQACSMRMQSDGFNQNDIEAALNYQQTMFDYFAGKIDSVSFQKMSDELDEKSWKNYVTSFEKKDWIAWWRRNYSFSAKETLTALNMPLYFAFGGKDPLLKADTQIDMLNSLFPETLLTTKFYKDANHFMYEAGDRGDFQLTEIRGYPKGIFYDLNEWMATQLDLIQP